MPSTTSETTVALNALKQLYATEGRAAVETVIKEIMEYMAPKCARCGAAIFGGLLWHVETEDFKGVACQPCQDSLLGPSCVTYFDKHGGIWT